MLRRISVQDRQGLRGDKKKESFSLSSPSFVLLLSSSSSFPFFQGLIVLFPTMTLFFFFSPPSASFASFAGGKGEERRRVGKFFAPQISPTLLPLPRTPAPFKLPWPNRKGERTAREAFPVPLPPSSPPFPVSPVKAQGGGIPLSLDAPL